MSIGPRCVAVLGIAAIVAVAACAQPDRVGRQLRPTSPAAVSDPVSTETNQAVPPAPTAPPSTSPAARTLTVLAGGDVLLHPPTWAQADADAGTSGDGEYDFTPQMQAIQPHVAGADLALCHLETPLADDGGPFSGYPSFAGPPQIATALAATGFDACSIASNHTWDKGLAGIERSVTTVRAAGMTPYGAAVAGQIGNPTVVDAGGVRVGLLSYTYGSNAAPSNGAVEMILTADIIADAAAARTAGAEVVVVSLHWGTEYSHDLNAQQREIAPQLLASPEVDLIVGHHAHVVQPIGKIGTEWVAYGLGNMLASHATALPANQEGVLARFTFAKAANGWSVTEAAYLPIMVAAGPPLEMIDLPAALAGGLSPGQMERYETAITRTREVIHRSPGGAELVEIGS